MSCEAFETLTFVAYSKGYPCTEKSGEFESNNREKSIQVNHPLVFM